MAQLRKLDNPEWKKVFVIHMSNKRLVSEYIKSSYKSIRKIQTI